MKPRRSTRRPFKAKRWAAVDRYDGTLRCGLIYHYKSEAVEAKQASTYPHWYVVIPVSVSEILPKRGKKRGKR